MNSQTVPILVAIAIQLGLGFAVFQANRERRSNQCFLLLSLTIAAWLGNLFWGSSTNQLRVAELCIREASAIGVVILVVFNLLRLSIKKPDRGWGEIIRDSKIWLIATLAVIAFCQTGYFLHGAHFSQPEGTAIWAPVPDYGNGSLIYFSYFAVAALTVVIHYFRDVKGATGSSRAELAFILIGAALAVCTVLISFALGLFIDRSRLVWLAPFRIVVFSVIIAYGIATQKIMDVGALLRRVISYGLLTAYLLALYALVWWLVVTALHSGPQSHSIAHVAAAIVIAIAMVPARGVSQRLAERLFIQSHQLDFRATVSNAAKILSSVTTLRDLLDTFAKTVAEALGTDRVFILLTDKLGFSQRYPAVETGSHYRLEMTRDQATIEQLESNREPIVLDELHRIRSTPQLQRVIRQLDSLQISLAIGIYARDQLAGVLLLGARQSGRIYGTVEQSALQVLCGQLAVAIENAELFTEVQNAKIYNETCSKA